MAVRFYDEALCNKLESWIVDKKLTILKPEETSRLFRQIADQTGDKPIALPLIAISREPDIKLDYTNKKPMSFDGMMLESRVYGEEDEKGVMQVTGGKTVQLDAIPIELSYQLDIYTRKFSEGDDYVRNFLFNLINYPKLKIEIPYNNKESGLDYVLHHVANVRVSETVTDNSDIKEKLYFDQFTRWTIKLTIDDAYLFSVPIRDNVFVDIDLSDLDDD